MEQLTLKLSELVRPERNIRIHTEKQLKEFERSVQMFGQIRPIVVDENNVILAGNGLFETLLRMGKEEAQVYKYTDLSENQKKKLMIADNRVFALGIENLDTLNSFLEEMKDDLDIPGFDEDILQQMVADADEITERISEYGTLDEDEISAIRERGARTAQMEQNISASGKAQESENSPVPAEDEDGETTDETTEVKKFVVCPKCGEKIWL